MEGEVRERDRGKSTELLPQDLIIVILLNLPVITLLRYKCVCKFWYNLILSPDFIAAHHKNHKCKSEVSMFCYSCTHNPIYGPHPANTVMSFRFDNVAVDNITIPVVPAGKLEIVGCSYGVVCLSRPHCPRRHDGFVLWNPATRQFRQYYVRDHTCPNPRQTHYFGFCFHPIAKTFKFARLAFFPEKNAEVSTILTSRDYSWKQKTIHAPSQLPEHERPSYFSQVISVKTYMYWNVFLHRTVASQEDLYILCFDMIDEMFRRIELPIEANLSSSSTLIKIAGYRDCLAVFVHKLTYPDRRHCSSIDVWVMNDQNGGDQSWYKKLTFERSVGLGRALGFLSKDNVDWIVLSRSDSRNCLLYDPETKRTMELPLEEGFPRFFWYSESLASLN